MRLEVSPLTTCLFQPFLFLPKRLSLLGERFKDLVPLHHCGLGLCDRPAKPGPPCGQEGTSYSGLGLTGLDQRFSQCRGNEPSEGFPATSAAREEEISL